MNDFALFSPIAIGSRTVRTRLALPSMASGTADEAGHVTERTLAHYERLVGPWHGLAFVEYSFVHALGKSEPNQLGVHSDAMAPGLGQLATAIRNRGAIPGIQLVHGGAKADAELIGRTPLGPSAVPVPAYGGDLPAPAAMTPAEVAEVFDAFQVAARRAERAGFEAIEIHAAHGYFFNQWLSPATNLRDGSLAGRAALLVDLVAALRRDLRPSTLIALRFPGQDRYPGGLSVDDMIQVARWLQAAGADILDVSSGLGGWRRGREQRGEGYLVPDAAAIRAAVGIPVIGVGGIQSAAYIAEALATVDMVAVGRATLADPGWPLQLREQAAA